MKASKFAVPVGVALLCIASSALADKDNDIYVENTLTVAKSVDVSLGNDPDCNKNKVLLANKSIAPKAKLHIEIAQRLKFACLRLTGTPTWLKETLAPPKANAPDIVLYIR
jgi:hypothetical protein